MQLRQEAPIGIPQRQRSRPPSKARRGRFAWRRIFSTPMPAWQAAPAFRRTFSIYVEKYITDEAQRMTDVAQGELKADPLSFFKYDFTQSPLFQLRFEAGHLIEGRVGEQVTRSFIGRLIEPIPYGEQAAGHGLLGDFRLRQPFQQEWNLRHFDVTTYGGAMRKMEKGADRIWLTYPSIK